MPRYIATRDFRHKARVFKLPEDQSLTSQLQNKTLTDVGQLWFAEPDSLPAYSYSLEGEDENARVLFCKRNSIFEVDNLNKIVLRFSNKFLKGDFVISQFKEFERGSYFEVVLKKAGRAS